jgi:predicted phage tail protein
VPVAQLGQQSSGTSTQTMQQKQNPIQTAIGAGLMGASLFTGGGPMAGLMGGMGGMTGLGNMLGGMGSRMMMPAGGYMPDPRRPWG